MPTQERSWHGLQKAKRFFPCKEECVAAFVEYSAEVRRISEVGYIRHQKQGVKKGSEHLRQRCSLTLLENDERDIDIDSFDSRPRASISSTAMALHLQGSSLSSRAQGTPAYIPICCTIYLMLQNACQQPALLRKEGCYIVRYGKKD